MMVNEIGIVTTFMEPILLWRRQHESNDCNYIEGCRSKV